MRLFDGRSEFYQYDLNQKLICDECAVGEEIHFSNHFFAKAAVCVTYDLDGQVVVDVPNAYLLSHGELTAYRVCCDGDQTSTADCCTFNVVARKKPSDYVYTETEVKSYEALEARIERLENGDFVGGEGVSGKDGEDGVGIQYIERTDGDGSAGTTDTYAIVLTDGTSYTFTVYNGKDGEDGTDGVDGEGGGADGKDGITPHIGTNGNWYLGTTDTGVKAKGEDGLNGKDGIDGQDGYTPVKGVDYFDGVDGKDGTNGLDGQDGADGKDGITPHIGENKNWFIGGTDTGIRAEGKDGTDGSDGSSLDVYSTEETVVGTWIDGKPLYRKVFLSTTAPSIKTATAIVQKSVLSSLDIDWVSSVSGCIQVSTGAKLPCNISANVFNCATYIGTAGIMSYIELADHTNQPCCVIIEYTKTTDTATAAFPSATALMDAYEEGVNEA